MSGGAFLIQLIDASLYNSPGFFLVALGVLVSIRFSGFPDLTVDGSYTVGAALYAVSVQSTGSVFLGYFLAFVAGGVAGMLTATVNQILGVGKIISSVLIMILLILSVPYLTSGSSIGLLNAQHIMEQISEYDINLSNILFDNSLYSLHFFSILFYFTICLLAAFVVFFFFKQRVGIEIRYLGSAQNPTLLKKPKRIIRQFYGLMFGNALVAIGGSVEAERVGGFNQNMGIGVILIGLAIMVLGESLVKTRVKRDQLHVGESLSAVVIGVLFYSLSVQLILSSGFHGMDVRLMSTLFLLVMLSYAARYHPNSARLF